MSSQVRVSREGYHSIFRGQWVHEKDKNQEIVEMFAYSEEKGQSFFYFVSLELC